ncbi:MFS transporter [Salinisphaera japonica]|uniref:MFS transporter n=1 Tax=Salinisphaera japonica YTM-1 TaxID=1209778 RepID=A0A423PK65_9GAMM|nr:MFS transporter [Salinisphaera japonica]ROO25987.1 MFS transporter [Salinisphaera japonica YTM-1]
MSASTAAALPARVTRRQQLVAVALAGLAIITAGSFTTLSGLLTAELSQALGWSSHATAAGVAVNMALYGAAAPFALHAMTRFGIRRVTQIALTLLIAGSALCALGNVWLFNIAWGIVVGGATGALTMAYGAFVARLWFEHTGTATGVLTAAAVIGQFAFLPGWAWLAGVFGWQAALGGAAGLAVITIVAHALFMTERASGVTSIQARHLDSGERLADVLAVLRAAVRQPTFWIIAAHFAMCGATTNGLMWSSFTPAAVNHGMSTEGASTILLLIGLFNVPGTIAAGWLSDRMSRRALLATVFLLRAATLALLPWLFTDQITPTLIVFGVVFGLFDVATVPPVIALANQVFGNRGPAVFAWINGAHQLGAGAMVAAGGLIQGVTGSFFGLWILAAATCVTAALTVYASQYRPVDVGTTAAAAG